MRRIRHHDDDGIRLFRNLLAGFADNAARGNELRRDGSDVAENHPMPRSQEMTGHRTSHSSEANKADINHADIPYVSIVCIACHPRPSVVLVLGLYSQPTQPRYPIWSRWRNRKG